MDRNSLESFVSIPSCASSEVNRNLVASVLGSMTSEVKMGSTKGLPGLGQSVGSVSIGKDRYAAAGGQNVDDEPHMPSHTESMNDIKRDDLASMLAAIEERMDARVERIERDTDRRAQDARREIEFRDAAIRSEQALRDQSLENRLNGFLAAQAERDKAQIERDKRYEALADRVTSAAEGARKAAEQAATVKANYWAAVGVQLLAVVAIVVSAYIANQGNSLMVAQTTLAAFASGKDAAQSQSAPSPTAPVKP